MSDPPDRELEEEARALLSAVSTPEPVPPDVKARALRRLLLALPAPGAPGAPGDGDGDGDGSSPAPGSAGPAAAHALARALSAPVPTWSLLVSFAAGGALAAAVLRGPAATIPAPSPSAPTVIASAVTTAPPLRPPPLATASAARAEPAPSASASAAPRALAERPGSSTSARAGGEGTLEAERAVLDVGRTALGRGDGANALRAIDEHARTFPRGALAEEREAMAIQALRLLGRDAEARARLDRFRGRFPTSLIRPALEADEAGAP
jgi:hypothetical protein